MSTNDTPQTRSEVVDITPPALLTPEGRERVDKALSAFNNAQVAVANLSHFFFKAYGDFLEKPPRGLGEEDAAAYSEAYKELQDAFGAFMHAQDAFLRSFAVLPQERARVEEASL